MMFASAQSQVLPLRRRKDLRAVEQILGGERMWAVKDPAALKYYHFSEEERFLYQQLDGATSLEEIQARFESRFAPRRLSLSQLHAFLGMLHQEGLLLGDTAGQGPVLLERRREAQRREQMARWASLLGMRFRGVDPHGLIEVLYAAGRWIFSPLALAAAASLVLAALLLVAVEWRAVSSRLPDMQQFLGGQNIVWLLLTVAVIKVLHELGHALVLRHFGGECHEIGPMLLCFVPCLYCNTTDAWMLPGKWQRAAVSAAGIGVELILAALATFLWWWSAPGIFNSLCLNVMVVCSVSTVLLNGNPLLRYDGYYVLSDLVEMPNLAEQAAATVRSRLAAWFLQLPLAVDPLYSRGRYPWALAFYWVLASVYRLVVIGLILWTLHLVLSPLRLGVLVPVFAMSALIGLTLGPAMHVRRFLKDPRWNERVNFSRLRRRGAVAAALLLAVMLIPLPARVSAPVVVRPAGAQRVYVTIAGTLEEARQPGESVRRGEVLARLRNAELELAVVRAQAEQARQALHVENLKRQSIRDTAALEQLPAAESALAEIEARLAERLADQRRLTIVAPTDGIVLAAPSQSQRSSDLELPTWKGSPLDEANHGALLETGTLLCLVGNPEQLEALALVDQQDIPLVRPQAAARVTTALYPGRKFNGEVLELSPSRVDELPPELQSLAEIPRQATPTGDPQPATRIYQARIKLDATDPPLLPGSTGWASIATENQSLLQRVTRLLAGTFR